MQKYIINILTSVWQWFPLYVELGYFWVLDVKTSDVVNFRTIDLSRCTNKSSQIWKRKKIVKSDLQKNFTAGYKDSASRQSCLICATRNTLCSSIFRWDKHWKTGKQSSWALFGNVLMKKKLLTVKGWVAEIWMNGNWLNG